jgi:signal transduction histidine kinase
MVEESKRYAESVAIPAFLDSGFCKDVPYQYRKKNGEVIDVLLSATAERDAEGVIRRSLSVLSDVTERKRAEVRLKEAQEMLQAHSRDLESQVKERTEKLRQLSSRIIESQERERAAIARELHDELGQILLALKMEAAWLEKRLVPLDEKAAQGARAMSRTIDSTIDEVRGIVMRLRPGVLDDLGLLPALEWLTDELEKRTGISCTFEHSGAPRLSDAAATAIYRVTQEALTNAGRYSEASRVEVTLKGRDEEVVLTVRDDGRGFDAEGPGETEGRGLAGIRERADLICATAEVRSRPGEGTTVRFRLPLSLSVEASA